MTAFWMVCNCKNGVSSAEMARTLKITQKSAWFMLHRVREVLKNNSVEKLGNTGGAVESDESFIGPNPKNLHRDRKIKLQAIRGQQCRGDVFIGKTAVIGMLDRETREIRAKVIPNVRRETLQNEILKNIEYGSRVYTDAAITYDNLGKTYIHGVVNHATEYVNGQVHTNGLENFWSLFKRNLRGTYVSVEPFHLDHYLDEQIFRFNNRGGKKPAERVADSERFVKAMSMASGKRLTYAQLTGKGVDSLHHSAAGTGARGTVLALVLAGLSAAFRLRLCRSLFLWNLERGPHCVLKVFPCLIAFYVFSLLNYHCLLFVLPSLNGR